jgi:predicted HicB family RNase H-like nuclease
LAEQRAGEAADWVELSNALFGLGGAATLAFATESERTAFCKTKEYKAILNLMDRLPAPPTKEIVELAASANGAISVRLPRSVHAALLAEAKAEGASLNQLCVSKLVAQLRAVV